METQEVHSEHQETLLSYQVDQELIQVGWRSCGVSILGDTKKLSGHGHELLTQCVPACAGELDLGVSRASLNQSVIL